MLESDEDPSVARAIRVPGYRFVKVSEEAGSRGKGVE